MVRQPDRNMLRIEASTFTRGSTLSPNEGPVTTVTLSPFWIDKAPVSNADFAQFISCDGYATRAYWSDAGWAFITERNIVEPCYWKHPNWNQPHHPVTGVSWWEAMAYATYRHKSLPSEAQWEFSARGQDNRKYPWGNAEPNKMLANYAIDCDPDVLRRSSTAIDAHSENVSAMGCLDMAGNLFEWCLDNAADDYAWDTVRYDPLYWIDERKAHIARGGSGLHNEDYMRCSARDYYPPSVRDNIVGFRCVVNTIDQTGLMR